MKTSSVVLIIIGIVVVVSLLSIWFYPSIQDYMESNTFWNGVSDFTKINQITNIDSLGVLTNQSPNSILIEIPDVEYTLQDLSMIGQFVNAGNTLLLTDDFGYGNEVLQYLGVEARFDHNLLLDPLFCYKNEYFPRIINFSPKVESAGIKAIVFDHGTALDHVDNSQAIAWSSEISFLDLKQNGTKNANDPGGPFVVAAEIKVGKGMVELVSDSSIMINSMVSQNDNNKFIEYLMVNDNKTGDHLLDRSHLAKSSLDDMKIRWNVLRSILARPYVTVGLVLVVFLIVICLTLKKRDVFG